MKRVSGDSGDIFKPRGQLKREIELAERYPEEVVRVLSPHLTDERRSRIDGVVAHRIRRQTVAVEGVFDPHNGAAVIRTAEASGLQTVHIIERDYRFLSSRKITQGTHKWVDLAVWKSPEEFARAVKGEGKQILVADAGARQSLDEVDPAMPVAMVFGNEHQGISREMRRLSDGAFSIPMRGFAESFNVSVAAAIGISSITRNKPGDLTETERAILRARFYLRAVRAGYEIAAESVSVQSVPSSYISST